MEETTQIEKTRKLQNAGFAVLVDADLLIGGEGNEETEFLAFQRHLYGLEDGDIHRLCNALQELVNEKRKNGMEDAYVDVNIMQDSLHFQLSLRSPQKFDPLVCDEIAEDYPNWVKVARDFPEVSSDHLVAMANHLTDKYSKKH